MRGAYVATGINSIALCIVWNALKLIDSPYLEVGTCLECVIDIGYYIAHYHYPVLLTVIYMAI